MGAGGFACGCGAGGGGLEENRGRIGMFGCACAGC